MKSTLLCLSIAFVMYSPIYCQNVNIPDSNFKTALVNNPSINTNSDTEIQVSEAQAYTGFLDVSNKGIFDLTGIEAFIALDSLDCGYNQLMSLDVSNNTALTYLDCFFNELSNLNVGNTTLTYLYCGDNDLTNLDVSANTALTYLYCGTNQITSLDVSSNTALTYLNFGVNQLTNLDVSNNTALTFLGCSHNQLTNLDVSNNTALTCLACNFNDLTNLDVSNNTALIGLGCNSNQLTNLDVSTNTALTSFGCSSNQLASLNVKNGNNTNIPMFSFLAENNPNLSCIQVDSVAYSVANWTNIDPTAFFSEDCTTSVSDLEYQLEDFSPYPNPTTGQINIELGEVKDVSLSVYAISGQIIYQRENINESLHVFDINKAAAGLYVVEVKTGGKRQHYKLIKQ